MKTEGRMPKQLQLKLFGSIVEFMTTVGLSEADIRRAFEEAVAKSSAKWPNPAGRNVDGKYQPNGDVSAHLLRMWYRDSRLIDSADCKPRPLPLSRGRNSLRALIGKLDPGADAAAVLKTMKAVGLIRRTASGRYLPTASAAVIPKMHPWMIEHAARSVIRLVSTVHRNANPTPELPPLLERYSYVPDLNPGDARSFAEFARVQGLAYLDILDDWLEQRRVTKIRSSTRARRLGVAAGVHLITFLGSEAGSYADRGKRRAPSTAALSPRKGARSD